MVTASAETLLALGIVTAVGVGFAFFGYDLTDRLLSWVGWIAGAGAGAAAGWFLVPRVLAVTTQARLVGVVVLLVAGAIFGRVLIPLFSRFTVVIAGFVATAGAVLVVLAGGQVTNALVGVSVADPVGVTTRLTALPLFTDQRFQQLFLLALVAGVFGAVAAARFYEVVVTLAATGVGAALLGAAAPMWQEALSGSVSLGGGLGRISPLWAAVAFAVGIGSQVYRHREEIDLPLSDEMEEPLE
jgi:hypothetical protein